MPLKQKKGAGTAPLSNIKIKGKISYFGGPNDSSTKGAGGVEKSTASGAPTSTPGIAVFNQATLGGFWKVTAPNGRSQIIQQTDIGPAPWTGRIMDFTYSSLHLFGYTEGNFPTNSVASGEYLGKNKQAAVEKGGNAVEAAQAETSGGEVAPGAGATGGSGGTANASDTSGGESLLSVGKDLLTGNMADLGQQLALASLSIVKGLGLGFADLVVAPAWHWNQRATAYYSQYVIDPRLVANGSEYQYAFAWTAAFWGLGYVLFWTEGGSGQYGGSGLKPVPVHRTRLAHHVRKLQAIPARKALVKPGKVKAATPNKPKPAVSKAKVTLQRTLSTTRPRTVKVYDTDHTRRSDTRDRARQSVVPIQAVKTPLQDRIEQSHPKPHKGNKPRPRAPRNKRPNSARATAQGRRGGR